MVSSLQKVAGDNDNEPQVRLKLVNPADWHGQPIPERQWFLPELIPARNVTLLSGDGGVGKSLMALQIAAASALDMSTASLTPASGKVFYLGAEDEEDEFKRRLAQIVARQGRSLADLSGRFQLSPMAGEDATLALPDKLKNMQATPVMADLIERVTEFNPDLLVLDTSADLFGGDEINRVQVRQFVGMLRKIAMGIDCAVLLLSHPSIQGMQSGSGLSGSTAWNNSVRSRLYLTAVPDDDDARLLTTVKSNYGKKGGGLKLRWQDGSFVSDAGGSSLVSQARSAKAERVYMDVLAKLIEQGQIPSPSPSATYAPKLISEHSASDGISKKEFVSAQQRLLDAGAIRIVETGPPSRRTRQLCPADYQPSD